MWLLTAKSTDRRRVGPKSFFLYFQCQKRPYRGQHYAKEKRSITNMSASGAPPQTAVVPRPQTELVDAVRHWVHFDNLAETLTKQVSNARTMRNKFEEAILKLLDSSGLKNAILQINGANLQRQSQFKSTNLSWSFLEEQLHEYYKTKGKPDETATVLEFLQKNRGGKSVDYLKKTLTADQVNKKTP